MAKSVDPEQTAPVAAVCSGSTLFASLLNSLISNAWKLFAADDFSRRHFQMHFFLGALRVKRRQINCIQVRRRAIYKKCRILISQPKLMWGILIYKRPYTCYRCKNLDTQKYCISLSMTTLCIILSFQRFFYWQIMYVIKSEV